MTRALKRPAREPAIKSGDRCEFILDQLEEQGACSYDKLADSLRVTTMTIRRDLEPLIRRGAVIKTVGGVQRANAPSILYETAVYSRLAVNRAEKRAIAWRALDLIGPQSTIFVDGSTTCLELARTLAKEKERPDHRHQLRHDLSGTGQNREQYHNRHRRTIRCDQPLLRRAASRGLGQGVFSRYRLCRHQGAGSDRRNL